MATVPDESLLTSPKCDQQNAGSTARERNAVRRIEHGFRIPSARFRKIRKTLFAARPRRDTMFNEIARRIGQAIFGKSESGFQERLKRNADFRIPTPLSLYTIPKVIR